MRQDYFDYTPALKLVIAGNHKPGLRRVDEAICRRFHLLPFDVTIPVEQRDKHLAKMLEAEWPGILQWAIEGCMEWQAEGLTPPKLLSRQRRLTSTVHDFSFTRHACAWRTRA